MDDMNLGRTKKNWQQKSISEKSLTNKKSVKWCRHDSCTSGNSSSSEESEEE